MSDKTLIETLKKEAANNKVLDAVLHMFAARERTRFILTIFGVSLRMKKEGFNFSKEQYQDVFKLLAELGVGNLAYDSKGSIIAIKDIKVTLQSMGQAVINKKVTKVVAFNKRNLFRSLNPDEPKTEVVPIPMTNVVLTFLINGKPINLSIPGDLDSRDIGDLVVRLKDNTA